MHAPGCLRLAHNLAEMDLCGSEAGSYLTLIHFVYHSTLGLRVIKKKKVDLGERILLDRLLPCLRSRRLRGVGENTRCLQHYGVKGFMSPKVPPRRAGRRIVSGLAEGWTLGSEYSWTGCFRASENVRCRTTCVGAVIRCDT